MMFDTLCVIGDQLPSSEYISNEGISLFLFSSRFP